MFHGLFNILIPEFNICPVQSQVIFWHYFPIFLAANKTNKELSYLATNKTNKTNKKRF